MHGRFCNTCRARPLPRRSRRPPRRGKASGAARTGGKRESRALAPGGGRAPGRGRKSWSFRLGFTRAPGGLFLCCPLLVYSSPCMPPCHVPCCSSTPLLSLSLSLVGKEPPLLVSPCTGHWTCSTTTPSSFPPRGQGSYY